MQNDRQSKPLFSKHLEELLAEKGLRKNQLAKMLNTTPQTISKACNGIRLSKELALEVVRLFPEYNLSWVLGQEDSIKYVAYIKDDYCRYEKQYEQIQHALRSNFIEGLITVCNNVSGFSVTNAPEEMTLEIAQKGTKRAFTYSELDEFQEDVKVFMRFRLNKLMEKGR